MLVPLNTLEPFPGNPRRGDVPAVTRSLARFGQLRPVLVEPADSSGNCRIVAGHHVVLAARELGWSHIAALANDFGSEEEARAYLLADNRTSELGSIDEDALAVQLAALSDFEGTGYTEEEANEVAKRLAFLREPQFAPAGADETPALDERSPTSGTFEVPLALEGDVRVDFARHVAMLRREWGLTTTTDIVVRAVREAAERA
jgi:ParB-like chromosome segregation protein Spo0J